MFTEIDCSSKYELQVINPNSILVIKGSIISELTFKHSIVAFTIKPDTEFDSNELKFESDINP